jgi:hypothetical protein
MTRKQYLKAVIELLTPEQIKISADKPSVGMTRTHVALHRIALRRLGYTS